MNLKKFLNIETLKNQDLFDIKSFVAVFSIYSIISIACADLVYNRALEIKKLNQEVKVLKAKYISIRTILMNEKKESKLLKKASVFGFEPPATPPTIIRLNYEY
tara:strand:+ start:1537 stop:1848 length:312 start_codon:yes stop_codon:yes gene_type:complete